MVTERFSVFLVRLDPTTGTETAKTRPCVVVSPDELNRAVSTVIIAPMTTVRRGWPTRVVITFQGKTGEIALDSDSRRWTNRVLSNGSANWIPKRRMPFSTHWENCSRHDPVPAVETEMIS